MAASEGIVDGQSVPVITKLTGSEEKDAHGNVQLCGSGALGDLLAHEVRQKLKIKRVRADTFGYLQRCYAGTLSDVDQHEAREVGEKAVHFALWQDIDGSVTIHRTGNYSVDYELRPLDDIAAKTRHMPAEFLSPEGNDVTDAFYTYARPLLGRGMPRAHRIRAPRVAKLLG